MKMKTKARFAFMKGKTRARLAFVQQLLVATVALQLAAAMQEANVTPEQLAKRLKMRTATITKLLSADGNPTLKMLARVFDALDCEMRVALGPGVRKEIDAKYQWKLSRKPSASSRRLLAELDEKQHKTK